MDRSIHKKKRSKMGYEQNDDDGKGEDRIISLPEGILELILSFLTTKEAARTSILAKYWEERWIPTCNLILDDCECFSFKRDSELDRNSFLSFVEKAVQNSKNVTNFQLKCKGDYDFSHISELLISTILTNKLEIFEADCAIKGIVFLGNLLNYCTFLTKLKLKLQCTLEVQPYNLQPNLTSLYLSTVEIDNQSSNTTTLKFSFPVLKTLIMKSCRWSNVEAVEFDVPSLSIFESSLYYHDPLRTCVGSIKIVGSKNLKEFVSGGNFINYIVTDGSSQVTHVKLDHYFSSINPQKLKSSGLETRKLLRGILNVEKLEISHCIMKVIELSKPEFPLQVHSKLEQLVVLGSMPVVSSLMGVLHETPLLKSLDIEVDFDDYDDYVDDFDYNNIECVPSCFMNSLERVKFIWYQHKTPQFCLAKFILQKGIKLKEVYVDCLDVDDDDDFDKIKDEMSTFTQARVFVFE